MEHQTISAESFNKAVNLARSWLSPRGGLCSLLFLLAGSLSHGLDVCFDMEKGDLAGNNIQLSCGIVDNIIAAKINLSDNSRTRLIKSVYTQQMT